MEEMTPFELGILLHYYAHATEHEACINNVPLWPETRDRFIQQAFLVEQRTDLRSYALGERGKVFIEALLVTPWPKLQWRMPCPSK